MSTIIFPVGDLEKAKALFGVLLGAEPTADSPYYVGYDVDGNHFGLDPSGHREGATVYRDVEDIDAKLAELVAAGAEVVQEPKDVGGGMKVATVRDADGNNLGIRQAG